MPASELSATLERAFDEYRRCLVTNPECRLDRFYAQAAEPGTDLDTTLHLHDRKGFLRRLLQEERSASDRNRFSFPDYWSRPWFDEHIDDVVTVLLEDRFEVVRLLGSGGQGLVYLVKNLKVSGRLEAMKVFYVKNHRQVGAEEFKQWKARFHRESAASEKLRRFEHVPMVYEVNERNGISYFTMQFIDGETLKEALERTKGPIPPQKAARWMLAVAKTLIELDAGGLIHRDIKPSNLMVDHRDVVYLVDFGLVKMSSEGQVDITRVGGVGTDKYVSDEQKGDAKSVSSKADIYSLGATFYHLLTGKVWEKTDDKSAWPKDVAPILHDLCMACLDTDAAKRPTAAEIQRRLDRWLYGISRRHVLAGCAVALAGLGVAGWFSLVPKRLVQIKREAQLLRNDYIKILFAGRCSGKGIIRFDEKKNAPPEVRTIGQSLYALLSIPDLPKLLSELHLPNLESIGDRPDDPDHIFKRLGSLFVNLVAPFPVEDRLIVDVDRAGEPFALHRDVERRSIGWTNQHAPIPTAESVIWLAAACAKAKQWWAANGTFANWWAADREFPNGRPPPHFESYRRQILEILSVYGRPAQPSRWSRYAHQTDVEQYSVHTTGIALLAQLEGHRAGFYLCVAGGAAAANEAIRATIEFLLNARDPETGWTCRLDRSDPADVELNLMLYTILLIAKSRGFDAIPADPTSMKDHCLALLRRDEFKSDSDYVKQKTASIPAKIDFRQFNREGVDPDQLAATEALNFMWYPWAIALACHLIRYAGDLRLNFLERNGLQLHLGRWVGSMGNKVRDYHSGRETFCLAEAILGLSFVESLEA